MKRKKRFTAVEKHNDQDSRAPSGDAFGSTEFDISLRQAADPADASSDIMRIVEAIARFMTQKDQANEIQANETATLKKVTSLSGPSVTQDIRLICSRTDPSKTNSSIAGKRQIRKG